MSTPLGDPTRRGRILWAGVCWVITGLLAVLGAGYLARGRHATAVPGAYEVLVRYVPGDFRTYGAAMLLLAALLVHGLLPPLYGDGLILAWLHRVLYVAGGFSLLLVWLFAWSWALSGTPTWQAMAYWGSTTALALLAARFGPTDDRPRRGR